MNTDKAAEQIMAEYIDDGELSPAYRAVLVKQIQEIIEYWLAQPEIK